MKKILSIVIPCHNEAQNIDVLYSDIVQVLKSIHNYDYEIIYVDDGSTDSTAVKIRTLSKTNKNIRLIYLSRNFGKEIATTAGIHYADGDAVIVMDADGQHPPSYIPKFIECWEKGYNIVVGVRSSNEKEGVVKKVGSKLFYVLFNFMSGTKIVPRSTDFRLIDRIVQQEFVRFTERNRITRGLIDWLGFESAYVFFDAPARIAGAATYRPAQLAKLAAHSFISLSLKPLFLFGWLGLFITFVSFVSAIFLISEQYLFGDPLQLGITGSGFLGVFISFLIGLVMMSQGMLALYLSHVHIQTQDRPLFVIDRSNSIRLDDEV